MDVAVGRRAEKRKRGMELLVEQPGESDRALARLAGVSPTTIAKWRRQTGDGGRRDTVETTDTPCLGRDSFPADGAVSDSPIESDGPRLVLCCECCGECDWWPDGSGTQRCTNCGGAYPETPKVVSQPSTENDSHGGIVAALWDVWRRAKGLPVTDDDRREFRRHVGLAMFAAMRWSR